MKLLIFILFIFSFATITFADDIKDFQIEGISVGDSLLDYFSEDEILNPQSKVFYKNKKFMTIRIIRNTFEVYDSIRFDLKPKDKKYIVYGLGGEIDYRKNIKDCYKFMKDMVSEIKPLIKKAKIKKSTVKHGADPTGKSTAKLVDFNLRSGGVIQVYCMDWSDELTKKNKWLDSLKITFNSKEFDKFMKTEAY